MDDLLYQVICQIRSMWRYRWSALILAWAMCTAGWTWVVLTPDVYEARARVFVDTSSQLKQLLGEQIVESNLESNLNQVRQSLLGQIQLEKVARATDMDVMTKNENEFQAVIRKLAGDIRITAEGRTYSNPDNLYSIKYTNTNRSTAIEVVETLLNTFVNDTLGTQSDSSAIARRFLNDQINDYENRLQDAEKALAEFNKRNFDRLPGSQGSYFVRLQTETEALDEVRTQLSLAKSRRDRMRQQLNGERPTVITSNDNLPAPILALKGRITTAENQLDDLLLLYTDQHPDIISTRESISRLNAQLESALDPSKLSEQTDYASNNPVYQKLQIALNEADVEVAALQADVRERVKQVTVLQSLIDEVPDVEAEYARLNRDYDVMSAQYQALLNSLEREKLTSEAQVSDKVTFRVIDPPASDIRPVAPNRVRLLSMIFIAGLGLGAGYAFLRSQISPVVDNESTATELTNFPVLGSVSVFWPGRIQNNGLTYLTYILGAAGLGLVFAVVMYVQLSGIRLI